MKKKLIDVAVVGASGMVGRELLGLLESRQFPIGKFYPFSSGSRESKVVFKGEEYICVKPSFELLCKAQLVFFVSTDEVSEKYAQRLAAAGVQCIDDSSFFRLNPSIPLVIPEVNGNTLDGGKKLIAGPNCTITGAAVALADVHRKYKIKEMRISTYQAVSGAGRDCMLQLDEEVKEYSRTGKYPTENKLFPRPMAFNLFPQVGSFDEEGNCSEENKVFAELQKIWNAPDLLVSSVTVRVPVMRGHSLGIWANTEKPWLIEDLSEILKHTKGLKFYPKPEDYPCPLTHGNRTSEVYAGRLRKAKTAPNEFQLWVVSDNLYKGAALNSLQIAELLYK